MSTAPRAAADRFRVGAPVRRFWSAHVMPSNAPRPYGSISTADDCFGVVPIRFGLVGKEDPLNWSSWIRRIHRGVSIVFTVTVIANFIALAQGGGMPPPWVTYSPLLPLALLLFTGLYLFVLPHAVKWRSGRRA
jgi:hypothetical protein